MTNKGENYLYQLIVSKKFIILLLFFGIFIRTLDFALDYGITEDEVGYSVILYDNNFLGHDRTTRIFSKLCGTYPRMFNILEKIMVDNLGYTGHVLRTLPLIASFIGIILFYYLATESLDRFPAIIAISLFIFSYPNRMLSVTGKHYIIEALVTIALLLYTTRMVKNPRRHSIYFLGLLGFICIWIAHTTIFIIGGIILFLCYAGPWSQKDKLKKLAGLTGLWGFGIIVWYFVTVLGIYSCYDTCAYDLDGYWDSKQGFLSKNPWNFQSLNNLIDYFLIEAGSLYYYKLDSAIFITIAIGFLITYSKKDYGSLLLWITPIVLVLIAASLRLYPIYGRSIVFLSPILFMRSGDGINKIFRNGNSHSTFSIILLIMIFFSLPVGISIYELIVPRTATWEEGYRYVSTNRIDNDIIWLNNGNPGIVGYYENIHGMDLGEILHYKFESRLSMSDY